MTKTVTQSDVVDLQSIPAIEVGEIVKINQNGHDLLNQIVQAAQQEVENQGMCDVLNLGLNKLNQVVKVLNGIRLEKTRPIESAKKDIIAKFRVVTDTFQEAISNGNMRVRAWDMKVAEERRQLQARIDAENLAKEKAARAEEARRLKISQAQGGDGSNNTPVPVPVPAKIELPPISMTQSTAYAERWVAVVTDPTKVPDGILRSERVKEAIRIEAQGIIMYEKKRLQALSPERKITREDIEPISGIRIDITKDIRR